MGLEQASDIELRGTEDDEAQILNPDTSTENTRYKHRKHHRSNDGAINRTRCKYRKSENKLYNTT